MTIPNINPSALTDKDHRVAVLNDAGAVQAWTTTRRNGCRLGVDHGNQAITREQWIEENQ